MTSKKKARYGNPARQAEVRSQEQARVLAVQAAAVAETAQRQAGTDCTTGCCG